MDWEAILIMVGFFGLAWMVLYLIDAEIPPGGEVH